jgi:putative ABC transport system permease protein
MIALTFKSIRANKARFVLTGVAVLLGVAFMAGTFVLTDTIKRSYDGIALDVYDGTDAVVRSARAAEGAGQGASEVRGTIAAATLEQVRGLAGVQAAEAQQLGIAVVVGRDGRLLDSNPQRSIPLAIGWQDHDAINPMELVDGTAPIAADEIVIDRASARAGDFAVGDAVSVVTPAGALPFRIVGVATYGGADSAAGAQVVAFQEDTAATILGTPGRFHAVQVVAAPGVSEAALVAELRSALAGDIEVISGTEATAEAQEASGSALAFVNVFLMSFAIVALVVGAFVIYNTFSITVAQRSKETALLRAIGARRRQVMRAVRVEALFTGVVASAAGVAAGIGLAQVLRVVLGAFGLDLPADGVVVAPRTIIVSMVIGTAVTVVAAWLPARRAAKVAPIEALRETAVDDSAHSRRRVVLGTVTGVVGAALLANGLAGAGASSVGFGAFAVFIGVAMLGPVIARQFAGITGAPLPRLRGMAGTLARENAMRNPKRTSATASALMIGIALVAFITVFAASAKSSMATSVDIAMRGEFIVTTQFGMGGLSPDVADAIDELDETGEVTPLRYFDAVVGEATTAASAVDPETVEGGVDLDIRSGSIADLGIGGVAVRDDVAASDGIMIGDTVTMFFPETGDQQLTVVATYGTREPLGDYVISTATFDANIPTHVDNDIVVSPADGVSSAEMQRAVDAVLAAYPTAELMTEEEFTGSMAAQINQMLNLVYVLLAMALLIALFGIANTLALSVFERTREIGLLRALGMSRAQVRSAVRWESVLIALLGTTLGTVIGLGFAWALFQALEGEGFNTFAVPAGQLAVIITTAAVAAVLAASRPARRAANLDVLRAISTV